VVQVEDQDQEQMLEVVVEQEDIVLHSLVEQN
jgi:hypothetical protein